MNGNSRAKEQKRMLRNKSNPIEGFLWRFLACCFAIDACIWGYFTFVEKVPVFVGLQRIYDGIHKNRETERAEKRIVKYEVIQKETRAPAMEPPKKQNENQMVPNGKYKGAIYSWTNKEGKRAFSNVGFPKSEEYTDGKVELTP